MSPREVAEIPLDSMAPGTTERFWLRLTRDELGEWRRVPVIVRRGRADGPVVALTAVLHGDELNGMRAIQQLLSSENAAELERGTLVAVPIVNVPGYRRNQRGFADGKDLNRFVWEDDEGRPAQRFAHAFAEAILKECDALVDLHTAGAGRRNAFYARVDLDDAPSAHIARVVAPPIIAHKEPHERALRGFAAAQGVPAVVLEIGDPDRFQPALVHAAEVGLLRLLAEWRMIRGASESAGNPIVCRDTYWVRATEGGTASITVGPGDRVHSEQMVGVVRDVWGDVREEIRVGLGGVVVGTLRRPTVMAASPIVHVGVPIEENGCASES